MVRINCFKIETTVQFIVYCFSSTIQLRQLVTDILEKIYYMQSFKRDPFKGSAHKPRLTFGILWVSIYFPFMRNRSQWGWWLGGL